MAIQNEIWKDVVGFEQNYSISSLGNIKRKASLFIRSDGIIRRFKERVLGGNYNKGYRFVALQKGSESKKYPIHRMVAMAFIANPFNYPQVNHKNGIQSDNRIENLEWCTNEYNSRHSREILGKDTGIQNRKPVICTSTGIEYVSAREAARKLGIKYCNIYNVLNNNSKTTMGGLTFIYK